MTRHAERAAELAVMLFDPQTPAEIERRQRDAAARTLRAENQRRADAAKGYGSRSPRITGTVIVEDTEPAAARALFGSSR